MKEKIKNLFTNNLAIIVFALSFIFDAQYQILERFITDVFWLNIVKGLGAMILAYFTKEKLGLFKFMNTQKDSDLGGSNPPPIKDEK